MKTTFGTFVREKRLDKNIGLRDFAKMVELSPAYISQMENGVCKPPMESKVIKIAEILEMDKDYLLALACKISTENKEKLLKEILEKNNLI
jgi:transcriptional regulator with XRE-family HTH domain